MKNVLLVLIAAVSLSCEHNSLVLDSRTPLELETRIIRDYQFLRYTYFFLDFDYREHYRRYTNDLSHTALPGEFEINGEQIEVYLAGPGFETRFPGQVSRGWATLSGSVVSPQDTNSVIPGKVEIGYFIRLEKNEYNVNTQLGWIRLNNPIAEGEILAVAYSTKNGETFGDIARPDTATGTMILKLIKSRNAHPRVATANLEWKHIYSLGGDNIQREWFDVKVFFQPTTGVPEETDRSGHEWLQIFGLDRKDKNGAFNPDGIIDLDSNLVDLVNGELHFPDLRPFDPIGYFVSGVLTQSLADEKRVPAIYDTTAQPVINALNRFFIEIKQAADKN